MLLKTFSKQGALVVAVATLAICAASPSLAQETWDNGAADQNWDNPINWTNDTFPSGVNATVNTATAGQFPIISATPTSGTPVDIFIGDGAGNAGRLDQTSGAFSTGAGNWIWVGRNGGNGTYNMTGDASFTAGAMNLGAWGGGGGTNEWNVNTSGTIDLTAGTRGGFGGSLLIGENSDGGSATLNLDNGTINSMTGSQIGTAGPAASTTGTLNMTGGALNTTGEIVFGRDANGSGVATQSGGTNSSTSFFVIGRGGTGTYDLSGSGIVNAATASDFAVLGSFAGASGTLNMTGGTFNAGDADTASNFLIAEGGNGTVNITGSTSSVNVFGDLIFSANGGTGTLNLVADAGGFSPITVGGDVNLTSAANDILTVDLSAYTGAFTNLTLIDGTTSAGEFTGLFQGDSVGLDGNSNEYFIDYTVAGDVRLTTTSIVLNQWDVDGGGSFNTSGNWSDNIVPTGLALFAGALTAPNAPAVVTVDSAATVDTVRFSNGSDYILAGPAALTLTGAANVNVVSGRHWNRGNLAGTNGLNLTGAGEFVLDGTNSYSGGITVDDTNLSITKATAIPAGNSIGASNGAQVRFWGSNNGFFGDGTANGTGIATGLDPGTTMTVNGNVAIDATSGVEVNDGANVAFTGVISGAGTVTVNSGSTVAVSGANTYTGVTTVNGGTLTANNAASLGVGDGTAATQSVIGGNANTGTLALSNNITVANELLQFNGREGDASDAVGLSSAGNNAWNGNIIGGAGGSQYNFESTSGTLALGGTISAPDTGARNLVFGGAGNINLTGRITDQTVDAAGNIQTGTSTGANVDVIKRGSGTMTVAAVAAASVNDEMWFGNTTVEGGTLVLTANAGSDNELFSPVTTVRTGATLDISSFAGGYDVGIGDELAGGGTFNVGANSLNLFDDNSVTPGDSIGTLRVTGNVSLTQDVGGGALNYELGNTTTTGVGNTENDLISITGALTTSGAPSMSLNITAVENALAAGTYRLISHTGGSTDFTAVTPVAVNPQGTTLNIRQGLAVSGATAGQVNLTVTGTARNLTWNGTGGSNTWDVASSTNWLNGAVASDFRDLDAVTFGAAAAEKNVVVNTAVTPASTTFNSASSYAFSGTGGIEGSGPVNVNAGTVQMFNTGNNYQGATTVANGASLGMVSASTGAMTVNGTLSLGNGAPATLIDDFTSGLGSYTNTVILDTDPGGGANTAAWQITGETLEYNTTAYQSIEQSAFIRSGLSLAVGEELQVDVTHSAASQDIGLYVGGTTPVAGTRQDYIAVYARNNGQVFSRGFDGVGEYGLTGGGTPAYTSLFIARTDDNTFEAGYYDASGRNIITTRNPTTPNTADVVGFYNDVRASGVLGNADNLRIVDLESVSTLDVNGDFTLGASGTLQLDITSIGIDTLDISGVATLTGEIAVSLESGFTPIDGVQYTILSAAGGIATVLGSLDFGAGLPDGFTASYNDAMTDLILTFASGLPGDFNGDGIVNAADYTVYRDHVGATEDGVVLNGNGDGGTVGPTDYALWKSNFGNTSAAAINSLQAAASVPEPSSAVLLAMLIGGSVLAYRKLAN